MNHRMLSHTQIVKQLIISFIKGLSHLLMWPLHNLRKCLYGIIAGAALLFISMIVRDIRSGRLIVCDIPTPKSLEEKGYNSRVMADKIIYSIKLGGSKRSELFPKYEGSDISINPVIMTLRSDSENLTVYGNSYNLILNLFSKLLHKPIPIVRGNIVETKTNSYLLTFSIDGKSVYRLPFTASQTENVIKETGLKVCLSVFPYELASSYYEMQRYSECLSALEKYIPQNTNQTMAKLVLQGAAQLNLFEYDEALKAFVTAYETENRIFILHNIASVRLEQCLYKEAIEFEDLLVQTKRESDSGHTTAAIAYSKLLDLENAEKHFRRALEINPNFSPAYFQWGVMLWLRNNDLKGAIAKYRQCLEVDPNFYQCASNLAHANAELGNAKEAELYTGKALSIIKDKSLRVDYEVKGDTLVIGDTLSTAQKRLKKAAITK